MGRLDTTPSRTRGPCSTQDRVIEERKGTSTKITNEYLPGGTKANSGRGMRSVVLKEGGAENYQESNTTRRGNEERIYGETKEVSLPSQQMNGMLFGK